MFQQISVTAANSLKLPKDVVLGEILVTFVGRHCVTIENYRGILVYDDQNVKVQGKQCKVWIRGKRLHIDYYNHEEMQVSGVIQSLEFGD